MWYGNKKFWMLLNISQWSQSDSWCKYSHCVKQIIDYTWWLPTVIIPVAMDFLDFSWKLMHQYTSFLRIATIEDNFEVSIIVYRKLENVIILHSKINVSEITGVYNFMHFLPNGILIFTLLFPLFVPSFLPSFVLPLLTDHWHFS